MIFYSGMLARRIHMMIVIRLCFIRLEFILFFSSPELLISVENVLCPKWLACG